MVHERLGVQDAAFLHLETRTSPMHVGSVVLFEGGPLLDAGGAVRLDDVRRHVAGRLDRVPRFRQRLMQVPFAAGRPVWVDDDRFDLAAHVRRATLPAPGTEAQLLEVAARIHAATLDRRRPLWELWFVDGVAGDRVALVHKTHHAMVDGIASIEVARLLFDAAPVAPGLPAKGRVPGLPAKEPPAKGQVPGLPAKEPPAKGQAAEPPATGHGPEWAPAPAPSPAQLLASTLADHLADPAAALLGHEVTLDPGAVLAGARDVARTVQMATAAGAPRLPFNRPIGPERAVALARVDLGPLDGVRRTLACTVNDLVLAVVAGGLRALLEAMGVGTEGLVVKALVPVSMRPVGPDVADVAPSGNRVSGLVADLPVGEADPHDRLAAVAAQLRALKADGGADAADRVAGLLSWAPPAVLGGLTRLALRQRAVNLVVTNVPGPPVPLWLMGARLLEPFPYVGLVDGLGLAVAVVSYEGRLCFGLSADPGLVPDVGVMARGIEAAAVDLAAGS